MLFSVYNFLKKKKKKMVEHPPYSHNLSQSDFFAKTKIGLKARHFCSTQERKQKRQSS
jgi:hypothetical protein